MIMRMAHRGRNVLKPLMHEHDNLGELVAISMRHIDAIRDKLSSKNVVMTEDRRQA
jgi:hypothetical protein